MRRTPRSAPAIWNATLCGGGGVGGGASDGVGAWPGADNVMYVDNEQEGTISAIDVASLSGSIPRAKAVFR